LPIMNLTSAWVSVTKLTILELLLNMLPCVLLELFKDGKVNVPVF
jgi:hypothetical protein